MVAQLPVRYFNSEGLGPSPGGYEDSRVNSHERGIGGGGGGGGGGGAGAGSYTYGSNYAQQRDRDQRSRELVRAQRGRAPDVARSLQPSSQQTLTYAPGAGTKVSHHYGDMSGVGDARFLSADAVKRVRSEGSLSEMHQMKR